MKLKAAKKKKVRLFADLKQALSEALDYEQGKRTALRVSRLPSLRTRWGLG
jgi:hypothetical protein